ncbi:MAG: S-layer homology domain-containing protein [Armatimonadota bacterium]
MTARTAVSALLLTICLAACRPASAAREAIESWRSDWGTPWAISVNAADGSCWAGIGGTVKHLAADGTVLASLDGFGAPLGVAVNPNDGSCWAVDCTRGALVHISAGGAELLRRSYSTPYTVALNESDGSVWLLDYCSDWEIHVSPTGAELGRFSATYGAVALAVNSADGSLWVSGITCSGSELVHVSATGARLWSSTAYEAYALAVNSADGSVWLAEPYNDRVVHLSAGGAVLWQSSAFCSPLSVSVNQTDGSCWIADNCGYAVVHLASNGTELWRGGDFASPAVVAVNSNDATCWVGDNWTDEIVHITGVGTETSRDGYLMGPASVAASPDGSCWVADYDMGQVLRFSADGAELWHGGGLYGPISVAVNTNDGSAWVADPLLGQVVHLSASGGELWRHSPTPYGDHLAVNPTDGSVWLADWYSDRVLHLSSSGGLLWQSTNFYSPDCVAVNPTDGSAWVADSWNHQVVHLAASGAELWRSPANYEVYWVAVDPADGSCWFSYYDYYYTGWVGHVAANGAMLFSTPVDCPDALAVDTRNGSCWVLDSCTGDLIHIAKNGGALSRTTGLLGPIWLSLNPADKSLWAADYLGSTVSRFQLSTFHDVPFDYWCCAQVDACVEGGIVSGYDDGSYRPTAQVTRDQMAVYISRAIAGGDSNVPAPSHNPGFTDVTTGHWAYKYIVYAVDQNVVQGYQEGDYRPSVPVDRGQMAVFVARAMVAPGGDAAVPDPPPSPTFPDVPSSYWSYKHIEYCVAEGVVRGFEDGYYHPADIVTRAQMAVYICNAFELGT